MIVISFVLPWAGSKINNEKPQAPPVPSITYTINVNPAVTQQSIRGFGGAPVFHAVPNRNTLFSNANNSPCGMIVAIKRGGLIDRSGFDVNRKITSASFLPNITSNTKKITSESAIDIIGTSFTYDLPSLNITTLSQVKKVLVVKRIEALTSEII